jgi:hypothetical protein
MANINKNNKTGIMKKELMTYQWIRGSKKDD